MPATGERDFVTAMPAAHRLFDPSTGAGYNEPVHSARKELVLMSALYKLPLVLEPQPEGGFVVTCPFLPELITEGDTVEECLHNADDALEAVLELYEDLGRLSEISLALNFGAGRIHEA